MRIYGLDRLKFIAAIGVVFLHTGAFGTLSLSLNDIMANGYLRMAVPLFAILSGYFFTTRDKPGKWLPWVLRIVLIYLGLMAAYAPFWLDQVHSIRGCVNLLVFGYFHLWYLPAIACAAVATHYGARWRYFDWLVGVCALIGLGLQYQMIYHGGVNPLTFRNGLFFLLPFFFIGYRMATWRLVVSGPLVLASLLAVLVETCLVRATATPPYSHDILLSLYVACPVVVAWCIAHYRQRDCAPNAVYGTSDFIYFYHVLAILCLRMVGWWEGLPMAVTVILLTITASLIYNGLRKRLWRPSASPD